MKKLTLLLLACLTLLAGQIFAQEKKELTLEDAILKSYTDLAPRRISGLTWLNATTYIYQKGKAEDVVLISHDIKTGKEKELFNLNSFKELPGEVGAELKSIPRLQYIDENLLVFSIKKSYYLLNVLKSKATAFNNETEGISDVHFGPHGTYLTYVKDNNVYAKYPEQDALQLTKDGNGDLVYGKAASRFEFGISAGIFIGPGEFDVAFYRNDQSAVTTYPLVDLNQTPGALNAIKYPMAGGPSEKVTVEVARKDGKNVTLQTDVEKDAYICSVNWTPDGKQIVLVTLNRDQNHAKYQRFDVATGRLIGIEYEEKDEKYVEPLFPLIFTKDDGSEYVYLSQKDGWMHAYLKQGEKEKQLTKGKWVITKVLGKSADGKYLFLEGTGENPTENHIYQVDLKKGNYKAISKNSGTYHADLNPTGTHMITTFSSIDVPLKVVLADAEGIVKKQLLVASDPMEEYAVSRPELMNITNREGEILYGRMIRPHDFDENKKYPAVIYVYNGPHVQLVRNTWWGAAPLWMNYLAEMGYIVFTVDGRGSYNRGKDFEQEVFRDLGEKEMLDQLDGVEYLKSQSFIDANRLAVHGWSYGGYMTTSLMLKHPGVFKVGVAGGPVTNWKYYEVMYTERYMDTPESNPEGFKKTDLTNYANQLEGKLLLIHGMSDDVVVPQHNLTLVKKFVDEGVQVDFFPYPGHPHNVRGKDRVHLMRKVIDYIDSNLEE